MTSGETQDDPRALPPPPAGQPGAEAARALVARAALAPSSHNSQPWLFRISGAAIDVVADRRRALPVVDPEDRELAISVAAALGTLEAAARGAGLAAAVTPLPDRADPDLLARAILAEGPPPTEAERALAEAIPTRRTDRAAYAGEAVPEPVLAACRQAADELGVALVGVTEEAPRRRVAGLVAEGDRLQFDDPRFRRELASWVHSQRLGSRDGMSSAGFGVPDLLAPVARLVIRTFDLGDGTAAKDEEKIASGSPALLLLSTEDDAPRDWIATGRALARVLLILERAGLAASYLNQPIECASLRPRLSAATGAQGRAQILLRAGWPSGERPPLSPRRALSEVLLVT